MKKSIIFMAGLIGLAFASCDDKSDLGTMQVNEKPTVIAANGVAIQTPFAASGANALNLQNYENVEVPVLNIAISNEFPENAMIQGVMELAATDDFADSQEIALTSEATETVYGHLVEAVGGAGRCMTGLVGANEWDDAFVHYYGPNPDVNHIMYGRVKLYLMQDKQATVIYAPDGGEWWPTLEFNVSPIDLKYDIAKAYNFAYWTGNSTGETVPSNATLVPMYHNDAEHVYADPIFNVFFDVDEAQAAAGFHWAVVDAINPEKVYSIGEGFAADANKGRIAVAPSGTTPVWGVITDQGSYKFEADMLLKTYTVGVAPKELYAYTAKTQFDGAPILATFNYINYQGALGCQDNIWCLVGQKSFSPTAFFYDGQYTYVNQPEYVEAGKLVLSSNGAALSDSNGIPRPGGRFGFSFIKVNLQEMYYEAIYVGSTSGLGVTGDHNNWGNKDTDGNTVKDSPLNAKRSENYLIWTGDVTFTKANSEFKIRANDAWNLDFGGYTTAEKMNVLTEAENGVNYVANGSFYNPNTGETGGRNMVIAEPGTYTITVDFHYYPAIMTVKKK